MAHTAETFANSVLHDLCQAEPAAGALRVRARGKMATIGIDDAGAWVPLLRLSNPSASFNVMSLDVRHHERWEPTFVRGAPSDLSAALRGDLRFTWEIEVNAVATDALDETRTSDHEH